MGQRVVGIDASRLAVAQRTGTENYSFHLIQALLAHSSNLRYRLYFNARHPPTDLSLDAELRPIPLLRLWTHLRLSAEMLRCRPDLLFIPAHVIPLAHPRTVVTIHDLGYLHFPDTHPRRQRLMLDATTRWSARAAAHIITPSRATATDLHQHYGVQLNRISVIHHGVTDRFKPVSTVAAAQLRGNYKLDRPYVLAVGTIQPRKNYVRLATAVRRLNELGHELDLVIAGKPGWLADGVMRDLASSGLGRQLHVLDFVPDADLAALYTGAAVFAMPSLYEGFGLPLIEAMACGVPTVAARSSSLPEIAGDATELFDPQRTEQMVEAIRTVIEQPMIAANLRAAGLNRSSMFTWGSAAVQTVQLFERVLQ